MTGEPGGYEPRRRTIAMTATPDDPAPRDSEDEAPADSSTAGRAGAEIGETGDGGTFEPEEDPGPA